MFLKLTGYIKSQFFCFLTMHVWVLFWKGEGGTKEGNQVQGWVIVFYQECLTKYLLIHIPDVPFSSSLNSSGFYLSVYQRARRS